jgi:H-NS histone family protein
MDLNALREAAIEATARALYDKLGIVPSDDSDEWEEEYRKQFAALKQRHAGELTTTTISRPANGQAALQRQLPELRGTPEEQRWGASIRDERLGGVPNEAVRAFLVQTWPRAKQWIDTRDVPLRTLLQRLAPQYEEWRKKRIEAAAARKAETAKKAAELAAYQKRLQEAGVTPEGLVELIDASDRFDDPAAITLKLAEIDVEGRHLRVFETSNPNLLLVKERKGPLQLPDYAIERDEGLVGDLKLFAQAP